MVRNWDTVRAILLKLEAAEAAHSTLTLDQVDGIDPQQAGYHMMLLNEAGLIEAKILKSGTGDARSRWRSRGGSPGKVTSSWTRSATRACGERSRRR